MGFGKCFTMALSSIINNKMRSFLTMLGIIIGVAAVIILVSLMNGLTGQVNDIFEEMGTNTIMVSIRDRGNTKQLDAEDVYKLTEENTDIISGVSPSVTVPSTVKTGADNIDTSVTGVSEEYADIKKLTVEYGRFIQYVDVDRTQKVCVIGTYIANELFGQSQMPIGESIKINGYPYKIVGILEESADSTQGSSDDCIYIPYTGAQKMTGSNKISSYIFAAADDEHNDAAVGKIEELLEKKVGDSDYYTVTSMKQMIDQMSTIMDSMTNVLVFIAGISLLVGGIGIMNIMLVSVTERTREIGIRKSLGAKQKDIMSQFVIEAGTVSSVGGVIGIVFGAVTAVLVGKIVNLNVVPSLGSVALSFGVSVGIGVIFGFLPARKASQLNPIDALRYE